MKTSPEADPAPVDQAHELAYLLALLAVLWPSFIGPDPRVPGRLLLVIALPTGHATWAIPARDTDLFDHVLLMPPEGIPLEIDPADTYRRVWDLTIGRVSIEEQAHGIRAAERSRIRGFLNGPAEVIGTDDGLERWVRWADVERALGG